jgi:radical SAM PhpK family P-methyltransferase
MTTDAVDCVIIGYNDPDFDQYAARQRRMAKYSGAYNEVTTNSVLLDGKRRTYMDLMNIGLELGTGVNPGLNTFAAPSLAVCYLQSFLQARGLSVGTVNFFTQQKDLLRELLMLSPRSVAVTTTYYVENAPVIEIVEFVRQHSPGTKIIVGGPHIYNLWSDADLETFEFSCQEIGADIYIVDSQGELTLSRTLLQLRSDASLNTIPNLAYFDEKRNFQWTGRTAENNDLDQNAVDWSGIDKGLYSPLAYLRTARSCPFACSFCNYPALAGLHVVNELAAVEKQLEFLHQSGTRFLVFVDDTFNVPLPRFKSILRLMIKKGWNFQWISFFRCSNSDEEAFDLMQKSGCIGVFLGIESGDQVILDNMTKFANVDRYRWGIKQLKERRIITFVSLICGFPGETDETFHHSIDFLEETGPQYFNVQLYYHDLRSPIAKRSEEFQIVGAGYSWRHKTMDWQRAAEMTRSAFRSVQNSLPLTLYGFSLWSVPYLLARGITERQIEAFAGIAREMLAGSFDDSQSDFAPQIRRLAAVLAAKEGSNVAGIVA